MLDTDAKTGRHSGGRHSGRFPGSVQLDMVMNFVNPFQVIPHKVRSALGHTVSTVIHASVTVFILLVPLQLCPSVKLSITAFNPTQVRWISLIRIILIIIKGNIYKIEY